MWDYYTQDLCGINATKIASRCSFISINCASFADFSRITAHLNLVCSSPNVAKISKREVYTSRPFELNGFADCILHDAKSPAFIFPRTQNRRDAQPGRPINLKNTPRLGVSTNYCAAVRSFRRDKSRLYDPALEIQYSLLNIIPA